MKYKSLLVGIGATLLLAACNSGGGTNGGTTTNNGVTVTIANPNACKTITNLGSCTITITYYAQSNSSSLGQFLQLTLPNLYTSNIVSQCSSGAGYISTTAKTCNITVTSQNGALISQPQTASIYPANYQSGVTNFIIGGGL